MSGTTFAPDINFNVYKGKKEHYSFFLRALHEEIQNREWIKQWEKIELSWHGDRVIKK